MSELKYTHPGSDSVATFLGTQTTGRRRGGFYLDQAAYIEELLQAYSMEKGTVAVTPGDSAPPTTVGRSCCKSCGRWSIPAVVESIDPETSTPADDSL